MSYIRSYWRSRLIGRAVGLLTTVAGTTWLWHTLTEHGGLSRTVLLTFPPLTAGLIIAASAYSPFGDLEQTASRCLPALRLGHLSILLVGSGLAFAVATSAGSADGLAWPVVRNLMGYAGLALLAARLCGGAGAWAAPLAYGGFVLVAGDWGGPWTWPTQAASSSVASVVAVVLLSVGLATISASGARQEPGEW